MKKHFITSVLMLSILSIATAQNEKYVGFMKKNLAALDSAKSSDDFQTAANNFERIASAEKAEWLPAYYAAYAMRMKAFYTKEIKDVDPACDKADAMLAAAESIAPNNSEINTIKGMVMQARMRVDGSRGMTLGPKATQVLAQALQQQPQGNPRAITQMAQMKYYTPSAYGGGKEPGIEMLKKAIAAYDTFKPETELSPNWGKAYAIELLKRWSDNSTQ